jgi:hypothetical protein
MAWSRTGLLPLAGPAALALALAGCVDMFTSVPPEGAVAWRGTTTAGDPALPECGAFDFELGQYAPPLYLWQTVSGRAWPTAVPAAGTLGRVADATTQWWLEGYVADDDFVQFESRRQRPVFFRARPYAVWRGTIAEDRMALTESGSPCGREVVLVRG